MSTPSLQSLLPEVEAPERRPVVHSNGGAPGMVAEAAVEESFLSRLGRMSSRQRVAAYRAGGFTHHERAVWACRYPEEVPVVNGEFEWIALRAADLD